MARLEVEQVTLRADGYRWNCPKCRYVNLVSTLFFPKGKIVKCDNCNKSFLVEEAK